MTRQVSVTLTSPEYDKATTMAKARQVTISGLLRQLLYEAPLPTESN
jgi:hypothetical protein